MVDRDVADGTDVEESVADVSPRDPGIVGFPDPAASRSHVVHERIGGDPNGCGRPTTTEWADVPPLERLKGGRIEHRPRRRENSAPLLHGLPARGGHRQREHETLLEQWHDLFGHWQSLRANGSSLNASARSWK